LHRCPGLEIIQDLDWRLRAFTTSTVLAANTIAQKVGLGVNDLKCAEILIRMGPMSAGESGEIAGLTTGAITGRDNSPAYLLTKLSRKHGGHIHPIARRVVFDDIRSQDRARQLLD
jgi:hypothetical protein